jgi:thioredoxin 1
MQIETLNIQTITDESFKESIIEFSKQNPNDLMVVDFWANWCGPCKALAPTINKIAEEYSSRGANVHFFCADVDDNCSTMSNFGVQSVPTLLFIKNANKSDSLVGMKPETTIRSKIEELLF